MKVSDEEGVLFVLLERFNHQRLPRVLDIQKKVNKGEKLNDLDIQYFEQLFKDATQVLSLADKHPEHQVLATKIIGLYHEVIEEALGNEKL